jgi:hypothetical protein
MPIADLDQISQPTREKVKKYWAFEGFYRSGAVMIPEGFSIAPARGLTRLLSPNVPGIAMFHTAEHGAKQ